MSGRSKQFWVVVFALVFVTVPFAWAQIMVSGTVETYAGGPADIVAETRQGVLWHPVALGRGHIGVDGSFELELIESTALPAEAFMPVTTLFADARCEGLTFSDPEARIIAVRDLRVIPEGAPCEFCQTLGTVYTASQPHGALPRTGDLAVNWFVVDRALTIEGTCSYGWGREAYQLDLAEGWNSVVMEVTEVKPETDFCDAMKVRVEVRPFPSEKLSWHYASMQ